MINAGAEDAVAIFSASNTILKWLQVAQVQLRRARLIALLNRYDGFRTLGGTTQLGSAPPGKFHVSWSSAFQS